MFKLKKKPLHKPELSDNEVLSLDKIKLDIANVEVMDLKSNPQKIIDAVILDDINLTTNNIKRKKILKYFWAIIFSGLLVILIIIMLIIIFAKIK